MMEEGKRQKVRGGEGATEDRHWGPNPQPPCDKGTIARRFRVKRGMTTYKKKFRRKKDFLCNRKILCIFALANNNSCQNLKPYYP